MKGTSTYENWASSGHSMHLCSIHRTRYCSLGRSISSCRCGSRDGGHEVCSVQDVEDQSVCCHIQPDKHGRNAGEWLEQNLPYGCTYERAIRELADNGLQERA